MGSDQAESRWLQFAAGIPAIVALAVGLIIVTDIKAGKPNDLEWCKTTAGESFDRSDYKTAAVCYARLLQSQPDDPDITFYLAESLAAIGQPEGARGLMLRLTPPNRPGYVPAHLWLARDILMQPSPSDSSLDSAESHLSKALAADPDDPNINVWCAILYAYRTQWDRVPDFASRSGPLLSKLRERLTQIATLQKNTAEANRWGASSPN